VALIGGQHRQQYFQMDPESQVADDGLFAVGPIATQLSRLSTSSGTASFHQPRHSGASAEAQGLPDHREKERGAPQSNCRHCDPGIDYVALIATSRAMPG
jgi:putative cardiolipin synthase